MFRYYRSSMSNYERNYSTLKDLEKDPTSQQIIVRLIRKWEVRNRRRGNQLLSLGLLLMDETGFLIKASINSCPGLLKRDNFLVLQYRNMLKEGSIYHISNFALEDNNGRFKLTNHKYNIKFTYDTIVSEVLDDAPPIKTTKFMIHDYNQLLQLANTNQVLPDVVGRITYVWGSKLRYLGSTHKIMARIMLKDGTKVRVSIWDHIASDFRRLMFGTQWKKRIVVITAVNPKMFAGDLYLNTSSATRFYINDDLEEVKNFSQQTEEIENSPIEDHEVDEEGYSLKTISQMLSFLDVEEPQEKEFLCSARITEIITQNGWFYISCAKCYNKIKFVEKKLICSCCNDSKFIGVVRFRIEVIVDDETDQARFVIFDRDATKLTNMLAEDLITFEGSQLLPNNHNNLPACLQELIGRKYIFQIRLTQFDFKAREKTFSVAGIVD